MNRIMILVILITILSSCGKYLEDAFDSPVIESGKVTFRYYSTSAKTVQVAGDWNNWGMGDAETGEVLVGLMEKTDKEGVWALSVELEPGRYRYRFIIDEAWNDLDSENPRIVNDRWGGKANLLIMP